MITSIVQLPSLLSKFDNNTLIFRGQSNANWRLEPRIFREKNSLNEVRRYELACYRPYLQDKIKYFKNYNSPIEHLNNLQHFDCATRLLDFTSSPLIALFFACYDPEKKNSNENGKLFTIQKSYFQVYENESFDLSNYKRMETELTALINSDKFYFIDPLFKNNRMLNQSGNFLLFPLLPLDSIEIDKPLDFDSYIRAENLHAKQNLHIENPLWYASIEIDKKYKESILNELNKTFGINENYVYPKIDNHEDVEKHYKEIKSEIENFYEELLQNNSGKL